MNLEYKKFYLEIKNSNFIVRDHRVYDVRVLPGVTFIDIIYRLLANYLPLKKITLHNVLFKSPVATCESFGQQVMVTIIPKDKIPECWQVKIKSTKTTNNTANNTEWVENATCDLVLENTVDESYFNIVEFKNNAIKKLDMNEVYDYGLSANIKHFEFMKALGTIYQGQDDVLMELHLGQKAQDFASNFHLHPVFLDAATFSWVAARIKRYAFSTERKPYIPLAIKKFCAYSSLPEKVYVYSHLAPNALTKIEGDVLSTDIKIYSASGKLLIKFDGMVAKRIRSNEPIIKLLDLVDLPVDKLNSDEGLEIPEKIEFKSEKHQETKAHAQIIRQDLRKYVANMLQQDASEIPPETAFYDLGLDSSQLLELVDKLETELDDSLYPTLLFEYSNINDLTEFFAEEYGKPWVSSHADVESSVNCAKVIEPEIPSISANTSSNEITNTTKKNPVSEVNNTTDVTIDNLPENKSRDVAIIGISGRYPLSPDSESFWDNIVNAKNCITEVPEDHWHVNNYFSDDHTQEHNTYSKWGGFIEGAENFDSLFFSISPRDAENMDPQLRLMLEEAWHCIEDAGYSPDLLKRKTMGMYVGVMNDDYTWRAAEHFSKTGFYNSFGCYAHELANRVSYFMDFKGPSLTLETACSSSLTAIHMARRAIIEGDCDCALAGGVNLSLHPGKYIMLSQMNILSPDGVERTFDKNANGYVPGEGAGLVMLKSLKQAIQDRDHIYGVIKGSAINHSGRGSGQHIPDIKGLQKVAEKALDEAKIPAEKLSYIETHGSGTALGDPVEIKALANIFGKKNQTEKYCALGSKANFGHLESASGVCALTKVVLSFKNKLIPPCANIDVVNPAIPLDRYPFYIPREAKPWTSNVPRVAGINSFGIGGANSFMVVEEYNEVTNIINDVEKAKIEKTPALVILSAQQKNILEIYVKRLLVCLEGQMNPHMHKQQGENSNKVLHDIAYTLQVGRQAMEHRLAVIANSLEDLAMSLNAILDNSLINTRNTNADSNQNLIWYGYSKNHEQTLSQFGNEKQAKQMLNTWNVEADLEKLAGAWVNGMDIDWEKVTRVVEAKRITLPTYPFSGPRHSLSIENNESNKATEIPDYKIDSSGSMLYFQPLWNEDFNKHELAHVKPLKGTILLFDYDNKLKESIKSHSQKNTKIILVRPGESFKVIDGDYEIRINNEQDYIKLVNDFNKRSVVLNQVVHNWCQHSFTTDDEIIKDQLNKGLYSLYYLTKSLMNCKNKQKIHLICVYSHVEYQTQPVYEGLSGFNRVLNNENPKYNYRLVEVINSKNDEHISNSSVIEKNERMQAILRELQDNTKAPFEVRYQNDKRYIKKWRTIEPGSIVNSYIENKNDRLGKIRKNGTYIISGGAGGLGLVFAKKILKTPGTNVVLLGRSVLDEDKNKYIKELVSSGSEIQYIQTDVTNKKDLKYILDNITDRYKKVNGIIHCAGCIEDSLINNKKTGSIANVIAPKVYGTIYLDELSENYELDFFLMFSSISAVLGTVGQADYAYANNFMDAYSLRREFLRKQGKRSGKSLSINWPLWAQKGMSVDKLIEARVFKNTGLKSMDTEKGLVAINELLELDGPQLAVMLGDRKKFTSMISLYEDGNHEDVNYNVTGKEKPVVMKEEKNKIENFDKIEKPEELEENINSLVTEMLSDMLKINSKELYQDKGFYEYGMDSIAGAKLIRRVDKIFNIRIKARDLLSNDTIKKLSNSLTDEILKKRGGPVNKDVIY